MIHSILRASSVDRASAHQDVSLRQSGLFLLACAGVGALTLWLGLGLPVAVRTALYIDGAFWWSWLTTVLLTVVSATGFGVRMHASGRVGDLLLAVLLAGVLGWLVPFRAYIEQDESSLLATAKRLWLDGRTSAVWQGVFTGDGALVPLVEGLDKRGMYFSFLQSVALSVGIPAPLGAGLLNLACGALVLFLVMRLGRRWLSVRAARLAAMLLLAWPVFAITVRSGLMDACNLALLLLVTHLAISAWQRPDWPRLLNLTVACAVLAQLRYESIAVAAACLGIGLLRAARITMPRKFWLAGLPLLLAPAAWRFVVPMNYEMPAPWFVPWDLRNVPDNVERLFFWLLGPPGWLTAHPAVAWCALLTVMLALPRNWRRLAQPSLAVPLAVLLFLVGLLMWSFWGQATLNLTVRYFLPVAVACALAAAWLVHQVLRRLSSAVATGLMGAVGIAAVTMQLPQSLHPTTFEQAPLYRIRDLMTEATDLAYGECNVVLVTRDSVPMLVRGRGALNPFHFRRIGSAGLRQASGDSLEAIAVLVQTAGGHPTIPVPPWLFADGIVPAARVHPQRGGRGVQLLPIWERSPNIPPCRPRVRNRQLRPAPGLEVIQAWKQDAKPASNPLDAASSPPP